MPEGRRNARRALGRVACRRVFDSRFLARIACGTGLSGLAKQADRASGLLAPARDGRTVATVSRASFALPRRAEP